MNTLQVILCIAGLFQFVSNGSSSRGGGENVGHPGPGRHGHNLRKPKRVFNGTMFVPNKELASLAQMQGGRVT